MEQINKASGEAEALVAVAQARAKSLNLVSNSLAIKNGKNAAAFAVAEQYIHAFDKLAKTNNTMIVPSNVGDISSVVAQVYKEKLN